MICIEWIGMVRPRGLVRAASPQLSFRPAGGHYWTSIGGEGRCWMPINRKSYYRFGTFMQLAPLKAFLGHYNGVSTKYLRIYLRWFERIELAKVSPRVCLAAAIDEKCIQFLNQAFFQCLAWIRPPSTWMRHNGWRRGCEDRCRIGIGCPAWPCRCR